MTVNPTKEEVDQLIRQCEVDGTFYHDLGNHNRAIARERIERHNARKLDEMQSANHAQYQTAVKGGDEYNYHYPRLARRVLRWLKRWSDKT